MPPEDQTNGNTPGEFEDSAMAQTTEFKKDPDKLSGVSDMFGLRGSPSDASKTDTSRSAGHTSGFTSSGLAPTALYVPLPDDATPRTLQGRYRLVAELGMGGMGVTYRAWDSRDGVPVVIKMPRKDVRNNPEMMDRFNREVRTMLELSHEHIVPITDHGEEEGCPFVAMRFLPGGSLSEYRGRDEAGKAARLSPSTLQFWLPGIARALDFMHSSGVLHRDVKPGNIFLDGFLKPFLGDFGIAKVVDESAGLNREYTLTATRMAVGTPEYMAPELFRPGGSPDGRVDQYALAVTVYEMLAGRKPFRGDSAHIIVEHASKEAPPLDEFCPDAPAGLVEAVHKGLAKNPEDRFVSCSEFAAAVLALAPQLNIDTSLARLLCPSCRAILRVSESTAGKRGKCPKCKSPVAVAQDLGSLWLSGEDRSTVAVATESSSEFFAEEVGEEKSDDAKQSFEPATPLVRKSSAAKRWALVGAALFAGLMLGSVWGNSGLKPLKQELQQLSTAHDSLANESLRLAEDTRRLNQEIQRLSEERDTLSTQRERLSEQNRQLTKALTAKNPASQNAAVSEVNQDSMKILTNSIGIKLKLIPAGTFTMGAGNGRATPPHQVTLTKPFYMGVYEVTNAQWRRVTGIVPSDWKDDDRPVEQVSWTDAINYCQKLSALPEERKAGRVYRLPTEAEWEYACRAGTNTKYAFGDNESRLDEYDWYGSNSGGQTHPVGRKKPNPWGLFDMHGNVREWCHDWYDDYGQGAVTDPLGPSTASMRVLRGGNWVVAAGNCGSAWRSYVNPLAKLSSVGFRLALSPSGGKPSEEASRLSSAAIESRNPRMGGLDTDMEFVAIPAGRFTMGSPVSERGHQPREKQVEVTITEAFEIGKYEVTQRQWTKVMKTEPWKSYAQATEGADHPATCVGWDGAMQFCKALTDNGHASGTLAKDKVYRLPTEAEWEYACRAGTQTPYFFGEDPKRLDDFAWCDGKPARPVGGKKPNPSGLFDMYGNVSEWCLDWNDMKPLSGGEDPLGAASGHQRMHRGGQSRFSLVWMFRSAYRKDHGTSGAHTEGFRVVRGGARPITPPAPATQEAIRLPPPKPLELGETFTLSDEALLALNFQPEAGQTASITKRIDTPGPGVEFDITFQGNGDQDCGGQWVYHATNLPSAVTLSTDLAPFRAFALQFELLGVDGKRPAAFTAPLLVGSLLAGYSPKRIDTADEPRAVSVNTFHESWNPLRRLGFVVNIPGWWYEKDPSKNPWPEKGCVVHLRVSPAPDAVPLPFQRDRKADKEEAEN